MWKKYQINSKEGLEPQYQKSKRLNLQEYGLIEEEITVF